MTDFSPAQLDEARRLVLARYGEMVEAARDSIYGSTVDAIRAAAFELVVERQLTLDLAQAALPEAIEWVAQRTDGAPPTDGGRRSEAT